MDSQFIFNILFGLAAFFGGWMINSITRTIDRLDNEARRLPAIYVAKDDYREDIKEVKDLLRQLFEELKGKADK